MLFQRNCELHRKNKARLVVPMLVVLTFSLDKNDVVVEAGDAMDVNAILERSPEDASKGSGKSKVPEFVCFLRRETVTANIRMSQETKGPRHGTVERFEGRRQQRRGSSGVPSCPQVCVWCGHEHSVLGLQ